MTYSLLIQGPLNNRSLDAIEKYDYRNQFDEIIISHWESDDKELLNERVDGCIIVEKPLPVISEDVDVTLLSANSTFWYSIQSTYEGLKKCKSNFTIKLRSDEYYANFNPMKEKLSKSQEELMDLEQTQCEGITKKNGQCKNITKDISKLCHLHNPYHVLKSEKMVFGSVICKARHEHGGFTYHIGDHLFLAKTKNLLETYVLFDKMYRKRGWSPKEEEDFSWMKYVSGRTPVPETILAKAYLRTIDKLKGGSGIFNGGTEEDKAFINSFDIMDVNKLGEFHVRYNQADIDFIDTYNECSVEKIEDMLK